MSEINREHWLMQAVGHLIPSFERAGYSIPQVKVSVGFPCAGGKGRHLGQYCSSKLATDSTDQIFLAPDLQPPYDFLDALVNELVHVVEDCISGYGEISKKLK